MLKQLILALFLLLCFHTSVTAQSKLEKTLYRSPYTYIYQLTDKEARNMVVAGPQVVKQSRTSQLLLRI